MSTIWSETGLQNTDTPVLVVGGHQTSVSMLPNRGSVVSVHRREMDVLIARNHRRGFGGEERTAFQEEK